MAKRQMKSYEELETLKKDVQAKKTVQHPALKGTLASVFILGALIVSSWIGAFMFYLSRN